MSVYKLNHNQAKRYNKLYDEYIILCNFAGIKEEERYNYSEYMTELMERGAENIKGFLKKKHTPRKRA